VDLKKRVRELDGLLNDLEAKQSDDDEDNDRSGELYKIDYREKNEEMKTNETSEKPLRQELDVVVDMVHSLSSALFRTQELTPYERKIARESTSSDIDISCQEAETDPTECINTKQVDSLFWAQTVLAVLAITATAVMVVYIVLRTQSA
jgi:hypothetical protein